MLLNNKTALITGCNRGIGKAIMELFALNGCTIYAHSRSQSLEFENLCTELSQKYNVTLYPIYGDITEINTINQCFKKIKENNTSLDILVNNAGIMKDAVIGMINHDLLQSLFETNVFATVNFIQYAVKFMKKQGSGSIINMASVVGQHGNSGQLAYSATKGAVISLTKTAAKELAQYHIRVNAIAPGMIDTDMYRSIGEERVRTNIQKIGFGKLGQPENVANTALFLASDLSDYITGEIIGVNGGLII